MTTSPYVLFNGAGFIAGLFAVDNSLERHLPSRRDFVYVVLVLAVAVGWLGARTLDWLINPSSTFMSAGFVFFGGLISATAFFVLALGVQLRKGELLVAVNVAVVPIVFAHAIGRIGCFFSGCCYGRFCAFLGARHPTQLYEAFFLLVLGIALVLVRDGGFRLRLPFYLVAYSSFRFLVEFLRGDDRGEMYGLSTSQWLSFPVFLTGIWMFARWLPWSRRVSRKSAADHGGVALGTNDFSWPGAAEGG